MKSTWNNNNDNNMLVYANMLYGTQPNFVYVKTNKIGMTPTRVVGNKFALHLPRRVFLKSKRWQLVFLNISCAFPFGTNPVYREVLEVKQNKNLKIEIMNTQDGSTYFNNFLIRITNCSRMSVILKRNTPIITVKVLNAMRELTPIKVKQILYNRNDVESNGEVEIIY